MAIIKPDAVGAERDQEILQLIEAEGFVIEQLLELELTKEKAEEFYAEHKGKPFFDNLVAFMIRFVVLIVRKIKINFHSGPCVALILSRDNAIKKWRELIGPTNPEKARTDAPNR